ncbi:MAG: pilus assembly protein [Pseudobdellovibrionaceae bacterium]
MNNLIAVMAILSSFSLAQGPQGTKSSERKSDRDKELTLSLGESRRLPLKGKSSVWVQNREIIKAEGAGSQLIIHASREGKTVLKIDTDVYQVHVLHPNKLNALTDLQSISQKVIGTSVQVAEGDLLITGRLYRLHDWKRLAELAKEKSFAYLMHAEISPPLRKEAQEYFTQLFEHAKVPPQTIIFDPHPEIRIKSSDLAAKKYHSLLSPFGVTVIKDESSLEIAPTVKVEITVAEIKRDLSIKYGLHWPANYSARILNASGEKILDDLKFDLAALENNGFGKILASPNILCRSGKEAEFLAGGEFPIKIFNFKTQDVIWKQYGILLRVKPKADSAGRISLSIETEVSTLDDAHAVDHVPGVLTNRVSSHFDLTKPQTIALSGLLKSEDGRSSEGIPLLSRLPILGALFSSKDFRENRSELIIFVRPTILKEDEDSAPTRHLQTIEDSSL